MCAYILKSRGLSQDGAISQWSLAFLAAHETLLLTRKWRRADHHGVEIYSISESQRPVCNLRTVGCESVKTAAGNGLTTVIPE
jgi:hypothetical protein